MPRRKKTKLTQVPEVGIFYVVGSKLWIDATPLTEAGHIGDLAIHERDHIHYWAQLISSGDVPYDVHPRGRLSYDMKTCKFTLLADRCILDRKSLVSRILSRMHLPPKDTETGTDSHYRCYRCLVLTR
jgi:hypothetical protein